MTARAFAIWMLTTTAAFISGLMIGHQYHPQKMPEQPRAEVRHESGAITLERTADEAPEPLDLAPGVTARTSVAIVELEPINERHTLQIETQTGTDGTRVTVKGPGIIGGRSFIIDTGQQQKRRWIAGAAWDGTSAGPWIGYQWEKITIGAYATKNSTAAFIGWRF